MPTPFDALLDHGTASRELLRATVVAVHPDGSVSVAGAGFDDLRCDVLLAAGSTPRPPLPGQLVLAWHPGHPGQRGVILGQIGGAPSLPGSDDATLPPRAARLPQAGHTEPGDEVPDTLVLEARESLTLRVGDGSITLRADGRILIKGRDLVSSAQRLNRIKGGAVSIN